MTEDYRKKRIVPKIFFYFYRSETDVKKTDEKLD